MSAANSFDDGIHSSGQVAQGATHDLLWDVSGTLFFDIEMECSSGTYVRTLINDLAVHLGSVATAYMIERTQSGPFKTEHCLDFNLNFTADCLWRAIQASRFYK